MLPATVKKKLASLLQEGFVLKRGTFGRYVEMYTMNEWNNEMLKVNKLNRFKAKNVKFIRLFTAGVKVVELDAMGRMLIPKDLMEFGNIVKSIVLASAGNRIEIWDKASYDGDVSDSEAEYATLAEEVMGSQDAADELP